MLKRRILAATLLFVSASSAALAAATQDEANRITASLQTYLGSEPGVITVALQGDDYVITLDAAPYIKKVGTPGLSMHFDPTVLTVRPLGNGQWSVSQSGPYAFSWKADGISTVDGKIAALDWKGTFDENLFTFTDSTSSFKGMTLNQLIDDPTTKIKTTSATSIESWSSTSTAVAGANGAADANGTMQFSGITSAAKNELPADLIAAGMPALDYTATVASGEYASTIKGFRAKAVMELVAWFVAHPAKDLIIRDQAQLKEKIAAALPLWDNIDSKGTFQNTNISTAMGAFGIATAGSGIAMSGVTKDGMFRESFGFSGLTTPPGIAPPWSEGLVPTSFNLDFAFSGFDLEAPAKLALAQADFAKDPPIPSESHMMFLPAFAPKMSLGLTFQNGLIASPIYNISYDANVSIGFMGVPSGTANIRMKGLDAVIAKVQAAATSDPTAQQAMGGLVAFKGFGKAEADGTIVWAIDVTQPGKVLINGIDVAPMMGMAAPPPQP
ncbi:MAG: hypothetical protein GYA66_04460 [Phyllobacteriaceae bacterium]|nr:hypothetical protein [Phyllobacteriaceae bacterium]